MDKKQGKNYLMDRMRRTIQIRDMIFFRANANNETAIKDVSITGFAFSRIEPKYFKSDKIFAEKNRAEKFCKRFDRGHHCYGFVDSEGRVASYVWISLPAVKKASVPLTPGIDFMLGSGKGYVWDCFTTPEYRGRGLYRQGLMCAQSICSQQGIMRVWITCDKGNIASVRGILSAGFDEVFQLGLLRIGFIYFIKKSKSRIMVALKGHNLDILGS